MLIVKDIDTYYGRSQALRRVSLEVFDGEIITIIGSNGAGKTTLLKTIHGLLPLHHGSMEFMGHDISQVSSAARVRLGIAQVPEGRHLFPGLTVMENLELGSYVRARTQSPNKIREDLEYVLETFPILRERRNQKAGTLSGGEQQMAAMGRALMASPKLLLLDEPSLGLAPKVKQIIFQVIMKLNKERGLAVLLVEQDAQLALSIAHKGYVMQTGKVVLSGAARDLAGNQEVQKVYLGHEL